VAPVPHIQKRGLVKIEKGNLSQNSGHAMGKSKVSTQLIFSHLKGTDMSYRFK
jgi:hypothetical protein